MTFEGKNATKTFSLEPGGHRWQRIPPNEKRGRVHTSTVTVAVLNVVSEQDIKLNDRDLDITTTRSRGPGDKVSTRAIRA